MSKQLGEILQTVTLPNRTPEGITVVFETTARFNGKLQRGKRQKNLQKSRGGQA